MTDRRRALATAVLFLLLAPSVLAAQQRLFPLTPDTATTDSTATATTSRRIPGALIQDLPVDSAEGALLLEPGIAGTETGLSLRGAAPGSHSTWVDGIDVTPSHRRVRLELSPNTVASASALTGPSPAWAGGSGTGAIRFGITPGSARGARASYETDRFTSGLGLNRIEAGLARENRSSRFFIGGMVSGQKSAEFGMDAALSPILAPAGIDTTVAVPGLGDVEVPGWGLARGECGRFESSPNPGIADNYDLPCSPHRTPASAQFRYRLAMAADHAVGRRTRLGILVLRGRDNDRIFDYASLNNPANLFGRESESRVYGLTLSGTLGARRTGSWRLSGSRQSDRLIVAPLTPESEADTRDPAGGLMLGGFDFPWDLESFPVDSELVANYRANRVGSRRSPYELESVDQYRTVDRFFDGPYALPGFPESGGPVGLLTLFEEKRTAGSASATWRVSANSDFTLGGDYVKYDVASYDHQLTSQAFSGIYLEKPRRGALYAEDRLEYGPLVVAAGVRYDYFDAGGRRPWVLDTLAMGAGGPNPRFGEYYPFPRISSYTDSDGSFLLNGQSVPLVTFRDDERHSAWSPTFRAVLDVSDATRLRAGLSRSARMPDLAGSYQGINTDLAITGFTHVYGTDLGFQRAWTSEIGATHRFGPALSGDIAAYRRSASGVPIVVLTSLADPTRGNTEVDIRQLDDVGEEKARGLESRLGWTGEALSATVAWSWQRVRTGIAYPDLAELAEVAAAWERPHTLAGTVAYTAPEGAGRGLLRNATLALAFRMASGTPYVPCDGVGFSDDPCAVSGADRTSRARLPAFRQLDLRFAKRIGGPGGNASVYIDARNLLGRRNARRVYTATGTTTNALAEEEARLDALAWWRQAGEANGVLAGDDLDLRFAGQGAGGCAGWMSAGGLAAAPDCIALVRAEARWGDGDGIFSSAEQIAAADARHAAVTANGFWSAPRRIRLGVELGL